MRELGKRMLSWVLCFAMVLSMGVISISAETENDSSESEIVSMSVELAQDTFESEEDISAEGAVVTLTYADSHTASYVMEDWELYDDYDNVIWVDWWYESEEDEGYVIAFFYSKSDIYLFNITVGESTEDKTDEEILDEDSEMDTADASEILYSGSYKNVSWSIDENGTLTIKGKCKGNFELDGDQWLNYKEYITTAIVDVEGITSLRAMFSGCENLVSVDLSGLDTSNVTSMAGMFYNCKELVSVDLSGLDTSNVTSMQEMFYGCEKLVSVDLSGFDTSNVISMQGMFMYCYRLTSVDLRGLNISNVENMINMFFGCENLESAYLSGLDSSNVTSMYYMFTDCKNLTTLDLSGLDTSSVEAMAGMFYQCESLTSLDLSSFDTSKVESMEYMFFQCESLTSIAFKK